MDILYYKTNCNYFNYLRTQQKLIKIVNRFINGEKINRTSNM